MAVSDSSRISISPSAKNTHTHRVERLVVARRCCALAALTRLTLFSLKSIPLFCSLFLFVPFLFRANQERYHFARIYDSHTLVQNFALAPTAHAEHRRQSGLGNNGSNDPKIFISFLSVPHASSHSIHYSPAAKPGYDVIYVFIRMCSNRCGRTLYSVEVHRTNERK